MIKSKIHFDEFKVFCFSFAAFLIIPFLYEDSFAQETLSPRQQWKQFADPDLLTCKEGHILLQKK